MKKTNKENPITFFRKANEARQKTVKKSLKKAQDGIEMNDDLINKPGSKGGYKKSMEKYYPWKEPVDLKEPEKWWAKDKEILNKKIYEDFYGGLNQTNPITPEIANKAYEGPRSVRKIQGENINQSADILKKYNAEKEKKGGSVKRKK
jgi:hypothetical protein